MEEVCSSLNINKLIPLDTKIAILCGGMSSEREVH